MLKCVFKPESIKKWMLLDESFKFKKVSSKYGI